MPTQEFHEKLHKLLDLKKCSDENYKRVPVSEKLRDEIKESQKKMCYLCRCKTTVPATHHIQPDGESVKENLVMLCSLCHQWVHWILKKHLGYRGTQMKFTQNG